VRGALAFAVLGPPLLLAGCVGSGARSGYDAEVAALASDEVPEGVVSCLRAIGRTDVALDPEAEMSSAEIAELVACTGRRAAMAGGAA
jgi:hypothetical protein